MMCQCMLINYNNCDTLVEDVASGADHAYIEAGIIWNISVPSTQFFCRLKTAL